MRPSRRTSSLNAIVEGTPILIQQTAEGIAQGLLRNCAVIFDDEAFVFAYKFSRRMQLIVWLQVWCLVFTLVCAISAQTNNPYPYNIENWIKGGQGHLLVQTINVCTIIGASISLYVVYQNNTMGGGAAAPYGY